MQKITLVGLVKRMIAHDPSKRLTVEEVLYHPAFYNDKKKLDFLLQVNISVHNRLNKIVYDKHLNIRDSGWLDDNRDGESKKFQINGRQIFEGYDYILDGDSHRKMYVDNIQTLLNCLRNKVVHACDKNHTPA